MTEQALSGVKVLDFTQLLQGPYATQMLGDLGADVIKVERYRSGDLYRSMTFFNQWLPGRESPCFLPWNRNKRSISLDLKKEEGREIVRKLAAEADIVIENFRPGVMERLGLGYDSLKEINPRLIYCAASGWGLQGPYAKRPGQDLLVQGVTGAMMMSGRETDGPVPLGTALCDQLGALHIVYGVLASLFWRERSVRGQRIDVSLLKAALAFQSQDFFTVQNLDREFVRPRSGIAHPGNGAPFGVYQTRDGYLAIAMNPWEKIVDALEEPDLIRYNDPQVLFEKRDEIWQELQDILIQRTNAEWLDRMLDRDLWVAEVHTQKAVAEDPQVRAVDGFVSVDHPRAGKVSVAGIPLEMSETPGAIRLPAPLVGEHGRDILREAGYLDSDIARLQSGEVLFVEEP